ncbi:hypothetical protein [Streptomyces canus]|uniref:hypothetical protein n=1 Tax=Streptomyces canus TaxID=58343 RepID=UPI0032449D35
MAGAEAVVAKAGAAVLKGVTNQVLGTPSWPNMHAALMELHEILREWCEAAERTSEAVNLLGQQRLQEAREVYDVSHVLSRGVWVSDSSMQTNSFVSRAQGDIDSVLKPSAPVLQRWSGAKRRQAARRSLRTLMDIYCPELLFDFDGAVSARSQWVDEHHCIVKTALKHGLSDSDFDAMAAQMQSTLESLTSVRQQLLALIQERYPLGERAD